MDDKNGDWELKNMVNELTRGKELVGQLQIHLMNNGPPSSWHEAHEFLIIRILTSYEKALTWATSVGDLLDHEASTGVKIRMLESPPFPTKISSSGESESEHEQYLKDTSRKRSISIRDLQDQANTDVEIQTSVSTLSYTGSSGQSRYQHSFKKRVKTDVGILDMRQDNHTWRKYGQKPILGRNHPREYFKCIDRKGCSGRKEVSQSDKDPTKFEIRYKGKHTCTQASSNNNIFPSPLSADKRQQSQVDTTLSLSCASISIVTRGYIDNPRQQTFSSFHPASSSSDVTHSLVSPEISGTSYLSVAESEMDDSTCQNFMISESSEIVEKNPASTTPAVIVDLELDLELNL